MGAANLYKFSSDCIESILSSDMIIQKGCRIHEMLQGGIAKDIFSAFIVSRTLSEITTGLDSNNSPILFFKLQKNEYAFFGLHPDNSVEVTFSEGRRIRTCMSTLSDHIKRVNMTSASEIAAELDELKRKDACYIGNKKPLIAEINMMAEKLAAISKIEVSNNFN